MNTDRNLRFTAWVDFNQASNTTSFTMNGKDCGFELYDHITDPDENYNLAYRSDYRERVQDLFAKLKAGWRATMATLPSAPALSRDTIVI